MDPMELRLKNSLRTGDETPSGIKIRSCGLTNCITTAAKNAHWQDKRKHGGKGTGFGMACNGFISGPRERENCRAWPMHMHFQHH